MLVFEDSENENPPSPLSPCFPVLEKTSVLQNELSERQTEIVDNIYKGGLTLKSNELDIELIDSAKETPVKPQSMPQKEISSDSKSQE